MLIGYARVSKDEQNLDMQIDALKAAGCDPRRIFTDKQSGAKWDRQGLDAALSHLREGDTLVVWKMDRLGRTVLQSVQFLNGLHKDKIEFRSLTEGIDLPQPHDPRTYPPLRPVRSRYGRSAETPRSAAASLRDRLVTTFCTYPEPTPASPGAHKQLLSSAARGSDRSVHLSALLPVGPPSQPPR